MREYIICFNFFINHMRIQIVSDLHLEFNPIRKTYSFIKPTAPILCILGDLCCCDNVEMKKVFNFFKEISSLFEFIIWIPGNHEYYQDRKIGKNCTVGDVNYRCKKMCLRFRNIKFLKNQSFEYEVRGKNLSGKSNVILYRFICSTLWSYIPQELGKSVQEYMSDYEKIYVWNAKNKSPRKITYKDVNRWHNACVKYIKNEIENTRKKKKLKKYKDVKGIVLTHHKPFLSASDYKSEVEKVAYESDQSNIFNCPHVNFWGYGHTHRPVRKYIHGTVIASNPKGYPYQRDVKFNKSLSFNI